MFKRHSLFAFGPLWWTPLLCACLFICISAAGTAYGESKRPSDILGFDPHISEIPPAKPTSKTPVIAVQGLPDKINNYAHKFDTQHTFTVTFAFHNNLSTTSFNPFTLLDSYGAINVGQKHDALALLVTIVECYKKGYTRVDLFAHSRGGAATINALDMLSHPDTDKYKKIWQRIGITDANEQKKIREMVERGTIFLAYPLMNHSATLDTIAASTTNRLFWFLPGKTYIQYGIKFCLSTLLESATRYESNHQSPLGILSSNLKIPLKKATWNYRITIACTNNDDIVGNAHDPTLYALADRFPAQLKLITGVGKHHRDVRPLLKYFRIFLAHSFKYENSCSVTVLWETTISLIASAYRNAYTSKNVVLSSNIRSGY